MEMKLDVAFENGFEKAFTVGVILVVLAVVFLAGYLISPGAAYAEWDSSSGFGDSYYLREIAENITDVSDELSDISGTLSNIENAMP
jgi:hypothetical protein